MPSAARRLRSELARSMADAASVDEVLETAAQVVVPRLGADFSAWSTLDPADLLGTSCHLFEAGANPVPIGAAELARERVLFELEWLDEDPNTFAQLRRTERTAAALRLDVGDPSHVERYRTILEPLGMRDELRVLTADRGDIWGVFILYRDGHPFTAAEVGLAEACASDIAAALRSAMLRTVLDHPAVEDPPGSILIGADDQVIVTSPAAEHHLSTLGEAHALTACVALAAACRIRGAVSDTIIGERGVVTLHASPAKPIGTGFDGAVTIVVERPRPVTLTPLILRAFDLTGREREIAEHSLQGLSRRQIARRCGIAEATVGDHLDRIYRKAGVGSRAELCAIVFDRFYVPHRHRDQPSPYGWFAPNRTSVETP